MANPNSFPHELVRPSTLVRSFFYYFFSKPAPTYARQLVVAKIDFGNEITCMDHNDLHEVLKRYTSNS